MHSKDNFDIYKYDFDIGMFSQGNNKLLATFTISSEMDSLVRELISLYNILYKKIFVLEIKDSHEYILTFNIETGNINSIPPNTVMVHRKKEYNCLYSINALNILVKE